MTDEWDDDELVALVRGELSREELAAAVARLRTSDDARRALVETVAGHAAMTAAARTLRAAAARPSSVPRIDDEPLPELDLRRAGLRRRPRWLAAAVAAAVVLVAGVGTVVGWRGLFGGPDTSPQPPVAVRSVTLQPVSAASASGKVTMADEAAQRTRMRITTSGLAPAGPGRFYYAWLFDPQTQKMLPLGLVSAGGATGFEVSDDIVARYHAVDISLQDDNGDPRHSATSVLRATY